MPSEKATGEPEASIVCFQLLTGRAVVAGREKAIEMIGFAIILK